MNSLKNKMKSVFKGYSAFERKKFLFIYLLVAFPVIQMIVFWFYVNLSGLSLAFQDANGNLSLDSFKEVFAVLGGKETFGYHIPSLLFKSVFIWISNHIVINLIGILSTFILTKHMIGHKFFRTCYMIPGLLGTVVFVSIIRRISTPLVMSAIRLVIRIEMCFEPNTKANQKLKEALKKLMEEANE